MNNYLKTTQKQMQRTVNTSKSNSTIKPKILEPITNNLTVVSVVKLSF